MNTNEFVDLYKKESSNVFNNLSTNEITKFVEVILEAYKKEATVFACGNGGNVAAVQNLVVDLNMHPFVSEDKGSRKGGRNNFHAVSLCSCAATITGISNDLGYEHIFSEQLKYQAKPNDVLFCMTGSGNSKNVIRGINVAKKKGIYVIVLTGKSGGEMVELGDINIRIPSDDTQRIQEGHLMVEHILCEYVEAFTV